MKQNEMYKQAGERIEEMRRGYGYTRKQFAKKAEISEKFLYEIEKGKKGFSAENLWNIANTLGVSSDYILTGSEKNGKVNSELLAVLERFNEPDSKKLVRLLKILNEFQK